MNSKQANFLQSLREGNQSNTSQESKSGMTGMQITGRVKCLSDDIFKFTELCSLVISNNLVTNISPLIKNLVKLQVLDATNNRLLALPKEIGDLTNLRELMVSQNNIKKIPLELCKLKNLTCFEIDDNPLDESIFKISHEQGAQGLLRYLHNSLDQQSANKDSNDVV
ncbi:hypothetical protein ACOME3_002050 [Neoechinorhynchus agilis]